MLIMVFVAPLSFAQPLKRNSERIHYKCYLMLSDKSEVVHHFISSKKTLSLFMAELSSRPVYAADGITGLTIKTIYQCVTAKQSFKSKPASALEEKTPY